VTFLFYQATAALGNCFGNPINVVWGVKFPYWARPASQCRLCYCF